MQYAICAMWPQDRSGLSRTVICTESILGVQYTWYLYNDYLKIVQCSMCNMCNVQYAICATSAICNVQYVPYAMCIAHCAINWAQAAQKTMCYVLKSTHLLFFCCSSLHASGLSVFLDHSPNLSQRHASAVSSVRRWTRRCWAVKSVRPYWAVSKV